MHGKLLLLSLVALTNAPRSQERPSHEDSPALFVEHCAACHGETGDGKGWTTLDRPARSFRDGGFSYGNTQGAIFRTLTTGIPGTPMPSFDGSLNEARRRQLADYVITLGPPATEVERSDTLMELGERPVIVRGMLPPIAAGSRAHTRGLLIGMPSGMSFEYRTDDVRLLGLRQGEFCERTDWVGRGGTELKPLGQVVHLMDAGNPRPTFWHADTALRAQMLGSWIESLDAGYLAGLRYRLSTTEGPLVDVEEAVDALSTKLASGFRRTFFFEWTHKGNVRLRLRHPGEGKLIGLFPTDDVGWIVLKRPDGFYECRGYSGGHIEGTSLERIELSFDGEPDTTREIELITLIAPEWSLAVRKELVEVLQ